MKRLIFIFLLAPLALFGQSATFKRTSLPIGHAMDIAALSSFFQLNKIYEAAPQVAPTNGEVIKDSLQLYVDANECGDSVWFAYTYVEYRGGRKAINSKPVGYSDSDPCAGIDKYDTTGLFQAVANGAIEFDGKTRVGLMDYGRQQAERSRAFIFQSKDLKSYAELDRALKAANMPGLFKTMESIVIDSLVGSWILVRPGLANTNVTVVKTAQGAGRIRINAQNFFPMTIYADRFFTAQNLAGTDQNVDLYEIQGNGTRWVSLLGNYQLVKDVRQVVSKSIQK